jgi:hypothetical protein
MPLTVNFTVAQTPFNPAIVILTDTSTGSDTNVTQRRIYFTDYNGNPIIPSGATTPYVQWNISDATITVNLLPTDMALNVRVDWLDVSNNVLYTTNTNYCFAQNSLNFFYSNLIQPQSETYNIVQDTNYFSNCAIFWINIIGAQQSVIIGNDITASQACLNRTLFMIQNQADFF